MFIENAGLPEDSSDPEMKTQVTPAYASCGPAPVKCFPTLFPLEETALLTLKGTLIDPYILNSKPPTRLLWTHAGGPFNMRKVCRP